MVNVQVCACNRHFKGDSEDLPAVRWLPPSELRNATWMMHDDACAYSRCPLPPSVSALAHVAVPADPAGSELRHEAVHAPVATSQPARCARHPCSAARRARYLPAGAPVQAGFARALQVAPRIRSLDTVGPHHDQSQHVSQQNNSQSSVFARSHIFWAVLRVILASARKSSNIRIGQFIMRP